MKEKKPHTYLVRSFDKNKIDFLPFTPCPKKDERYYFEIGLTDFDPLD